MSSGQACPRCGSDRPADSPEGLCPRCLLEQAAEIPPTGGSQTESGSGPRPPADPRPLAEGPGTRIGPYKLLQRIGEGGMGAVYMAEQDRPVRRRVALKIIKPGMDSDQVIARFEAERQALALMDHPNIARVLDAGTTDSGRPFFVMELVHGIPITDYCDRARMPTDERLRLFLPVCRAIQHAHQKGIIHRDIKPSNVLVTLIDGRPVPKVIDFGVAKATDQRLTEKTLFTHFGSVVGTLEYMSPKQADLSGLDVDTRADVYALAVLLYELLTGSTPLEREALRRAGYAEVLRRIKEEEPPKPSTRLSASGDRLASIAATRGTEPARLSRLVRGELDWIVMKGLEKDRTRRYETASGFARDVERFLDGDPVEAGPPSAAYRLRKFARKHRAGLATAAGFVALLVVAAAVCAGLAIAAERARSAAVAQAHRAASAETLARERLAEVLRANAALRESNDRAGRRFQLAKEAIELFHGEVSRDLLLKQPQSQALRKQLLRGAADFYNRLEGLLLRDGGDPDSRAALGGAYESLGRLTDLIGDRAGALAILQKCLAVRRELADLPGASVASRLALADSLIDVGVLQRDLNDSAAARTSLEEARDLAERLIAEGHTGERVRSALAAGHRQIGQLLAATGRAADALASYRKGLAVYRDLVRGDPRNRRHRHNLAGTHGQIGSLLRSAGDRSESLDALERGAEILRGLVDEDPGDREARANLVAATNDIAHALNDLGRPAEAAAAYERALVIAQALSDDYPAVAGYRYQTAMVLHNLGMQRHYQGRLAESRAAHERAGAVLRRLSEEYPQLPEYRSHVAQAENSLGLLLVQMGRPAEARAAFDRSLAGFQALADAHPEVRTYRRELARVEANLGDALQRDGRPEEALARLLHSRSVLRGLADADPSVPEWRHHLALRDVAIGNLLTNLGRTNEAISSYKNARSSLRALVDDHPTTTDLRVTLVSVHNRLGDLLRRLGRRDEAMQLLREALPWQERVARETPKVGDGLMNLASLTSRIGKLERDSGRPDGAAAAFRQAVAWMDQIPAPGPKHLYSRACYHALLGGLGGIPGSGVSADEGRAEKDRALSDLRASIAGGIRDLLHFRNDTDLDPIRDRPDFRELMLDLVFPSNPFSPDGGAVGRPAGGKP